MGAPGTPFASVSSKASNKCLRVIGNATSAEGRSFLNRRPESYVQGRGSGGAYSKPQGTLPAAGARSERASERYRREVSVRERLYSRAADEMGET